MKNESKCRVKGIEDSWGPVKCREIKRDKRWFRNYFLILRGSA
jgi:hypothetical protein